MPIPTLFQNYRKEKPLGLTLMPSAPKPEGQALAGAREFSAPAAPSPVPAAMRDGPPPGMVANPEATNWGRLSVPRTDVPRYVPKDQVPQGVPVGMMSLPVGSPGGGIDVRSYAGSMWSGGGSPMAPQQTPGGVPTAMRSAPAGPIDVRSYAGSMFTPYNSAANTFMGPMGDSIAGPGAAAGGSGLPIGNPAARDAFLRASFPNANPGQIQALGAMAYNRPGAYEAARDSLEPGKRALMATQIEGSQLRNQAARQELDEAPGKRALMAVNIEGGQLRNDAMRRDVVRDQTEAAAIRSAVSPSVGAAEAIRAGGMAAAAPVDRASAYFAAGGRDPSVAGALQRDTPFEPSEHTLPSGARVIRNTPKSVIPDPLQAAEARRAAAVTYPREVDAGGRQLIEVSKGKFTDKQGRPVAWRDEDRPLSMNEFMASPGLSAKYGDDYGKYREAMEAAAKAKKGNNPQSNAGGGGSFEKGKIYKDGQGNRAKYLGDGKWENL